MKRKDFRFRDRLRVRWAEIDAQKIVFNGHYLMYFDTAIAGYWRALALPYAPSMEALGGDLYVRKATLEYHASARYDDMLEVGMRCARVGKSSIVFEGAVFRGEDLLVSGQLVYVFADPASQTSRPVPRELRDIFDAFEGGEVMVDVRVGNWDELGSDAQAIRHAVFVEEQGVPLAMEHDAADASALHALAVNRLGLPLATGRMLNQKHDVARIGRMAVVQAMRGSGVGRAVLDALVQAARAQGHQEVRLHAQVTAVAFYRRAGFAEQGSEFDEAGIAHIEMSRAIGPLYAIHALRTRGAAQTGRA
ncbi:MAG: YbgC/FadM family acyl-CoA thioesterase [Burkholderiales bacterium]